MKAMNRIIRKSLLFCACMSVVASVGAQSHIPPHPPRLPEGVIPAFPGAWGAGMFTTGGRGGQVIAVTNLNDSGPGSLRAALEAKGPRIVVFRVAGTIKINDDLNINDPDITIAGQSAPGDGICIAGTLNINTYNVVVRHLRVRRGVPVGGQGDDNIGGNPIITLSLTIVQRVGAWTKTYHSTDTCDPPWMEPPRSKILPKTSPSNGPFPAKP